MWKDKSIDYRKKSISYDLMPEGVHKQIFKIASDSNLLKEFECYLESKFCSENLFFWLAVEDLRAESKEAKRREKGFFFF